tara:strand:- start:3757 stop:4140 length:384 start_codon:yes stop_codon:yes gene_type:complete
MNSKTYTALSVVVGEASLDKVCKFEIADLKRKMKKKNNYIDKLEDRIKNLKEWMVDYTYNNYKDSNMLENYYSGCELFDIEEIADAGDPDGFSLRLTPGTELKYTPDATTKNISFTPYPWCNTVYLS